MRNRLVMLTAALLLASRARHGADAATPPPQPALQSGVAVHRRRRHRRPVHRRPTAMKRDTNAIATRATALYTSVNVGRETDRHLVRRATASHIGYRDQRYNASSWQPQVNLRLQLDVAAAQLQLPDPDAVHHEREHVDAGRQRAARGAGADQRPNDGTAVGVPCAPGAPPAACSTPALAAQAQSEPLDLQQPAPTRSTCGTQRNTAAFGAELRADRGHRCRRDVRLIEARRAAALGRVVRIQQRRRTAAADRSADQRRVGRRYLGEPARHVSCRLGRVVVQQPQPGPRLGQPDPDHGFQQRARAAATARTTPAATATATVRRRDGGARAEQHDERRQRDRPCTSCAARTTVNGTLQFTHQTQDDELIPWTINSVIDTPASSPLSRTWRSCRGRRRRPRRRASTRSINFSSRPSRTHEHRGAVPLQQARRADADLRRHRVRALRRRTRGDRGRASRRSSTPRATSSMPTSSFTPGGWGTLRVGYGHEAVERHGRGFATSARTSSALSYDTYSNQYVTVRAGFDAGRRRGEGFVETRRRTTRSAWTRRHAADAALLRRGGSRSDARVAAAHGDAARHGRLLFPVRRRQGRVHGRRFGAGQPAGRAVRPAASRRDELERRAQLPPDGRRSASAPTTVATRYSSLQQSRNANPPPDPSWTDPSRDWTLDNDDNINNVQRLSRSAAGRPEHGHPLRLRLQRLGQQLRARWPAHRRAGGARPVHSAAGRREHVAAGRRRRPVLLHAARAASASATTSRSSTSSTSTRSTRTVRWASRRQPAIRASTGSAG